MTIYMERVKAVDGSYYHIVYALREHDTEKYGFELNPWADTLGYLTDSSSIAKYSRENYIAHVLWEMTYFGFDEASIHQKIEEWNDQ